MIEVVTWEYNLSFKKRKSKTCALKKMLNFQQQNLSKVASWRDNFKKN